MSELHERIVQNSVRGSKRKASYSLDAELLKEFNEHCQKKDYKKSSIVENLIRVFLKEEKSIETE